MKKLLSIALLLMCFCSMSCKKEDDKTPSKLQIVVTEMTPITSVTIEIEDQNKRRVLTVSKKFENTTYETDLLNSGDVVTIRYKLNIDNDKYGNGVADLTYKYKGLYRGSSTGALGTKWGSINITIP